MKEFTIPVFLPVMTEWPGLFKYTPWLNEHVGVGYGPDKSWAIGEVAAEPRVYCFLFANTEDACAFKLSFDLSN
jgi:hypothetical protein